MNGLIMIAHGSKKKLSNNEFKNLVNEIKNKNKDFEEIDAAFLEFAAPSLNIVVKKQIEKNINNIYFYPYFLNSGKHVSVDLPIIINDLKKVYININFTLLEHFGKSNKISDIILSDIKNI
jgi:sirohydrochlorin cobaltochelatase